MATQLPGTPVVGTLPECGGTMLPLSRSAAVPRGNSKDHQTAAEPVTKVVETRKSEAVRTTCTQEKIPQVPYRHTQAG